MNGRRRTVGVRLSLVGALVAGSALAGIVAASPVTADAPEPAFITIQTGTANVVRLVDGAGSPIGSPQSLSSTSSSNCEIVTAPTILALTAAKGSSSLKAGLRTGSIGAAEKTSGESCAQVSSSGSESLTLDLVPRSASAATLDVELQKDAVIVAVATRTGSSVVTYFELQSGGSIGKPAQNPGSIVSTCNVATSSNSNNNVSDNCRWVLYGAVFDKLVLGAAKGQFSLEGGADGTVTNRTVDEPPGWPTGVSYFWLGGFCTTGNSTVVISGSTIAGDGSTYTRNQTNADGSPCIALPTSLVRTDTGDISLTKPTGQPYEQGVLTAQWIADPGSVALNATKVNFVPGQPDAGWVDVPWCPVSVWTNASNGVPQITDIPLGSSADAAATLFNAKGLADQDGMLAGASTDNDLYQYACVYQRSTGYSPNSQKYVTTEKIYLLGDVIFRG